MRVTQPFDASTLLSIDPGLGRRVDFAQNCEPVERPAERPFGFTQGHELVEWQMGVSRQPKEIFLQPLLLERGPLDWVI